MQEAGKGGTKPAVMLAHLRGQESLAGISGTVKVTGLVQPQAREGSWQQAEKHSIPEHRAGKGYITEKYTTEAFSFLWMQNAFHKLIMFFLAAFLMCPHY